MPNSNFAMTEVICCLWCQPKDRPWKKYKSRI